MLKIAVLILLYALLASSVFAAEPPAPTIDELRSRLLLVQARRETVVTEYRLGKSMQEAAVLKEAGLIAEENALAAMIKKAEEPKK